MKKYVLVLVTALTLAGVSNASASSRTTLRHRLHNMTALRNSYKAQLIASRAQVAGLQSVVTQRTTERDVAQQQVSALQARLASIPTPLAIAVEQVRREVIWADGNVTSPPGRLVAEAAMNYTVGHVSTGDFGYLELTGGTLPAPQDVLSILDTQAGICGQAAHVFTALVKQFGFPVRSVVFSYTDPGGAPDSHEAAEVYYDGGWHYFDPTFGQFWTDASGNVQSIADARASAGTRYKDAASFTNLVEDPWYAGDNTAFETDPVTVVAVGQDPSIG
jgi:transglutaminase-like putative cysteine protease